MRRHSFLFLLVALTPVTLDAQLSGRIPSTRAPRGDERAAKAAVLADFQRQIRAISSGLDYVSQLRVILDSAEMRTTSMPPETKVVVDSALVDRLLGRFQPQADRRARFAKLLAELLNERVITEASVATIVQQAGIGAPYTQIATAMLVALAQGTDGIPVQKPWSFFDNLLTNVATTVARNRALATTTLVELPVNRTAFRFVLAKAVSNADSQPESAPATSEIYRERTADALAVLQSGGNGVLRFHADLARPADSARFNASFVADAGVRSDDVWETSVGSPFLAGAVFEATWVVQGKYTPTQPSPVELYINLRSGARWANKGLLTDLPQYHRTAFGQLVLEFRLPGGKVPVGLSANLVSKELREYVDTFHIYTNFGR